MDQVKIGEFLKTLRKDKNITQEQLAEKLNVSNRTVSRWETGNNMPDLSTLIELADYYEVEIREILDGERKVDKMTEETRDTLQKAAEYSNAEKALLLKRAKVISVIGLISLIVGFIMAAIEPADASPFYSFSEGVCLGLALGAMITMVLYTTGMLAKIKSRIKTPKRMKIIAAAAITITLLGLISSLIYTLLL